MKSKQTGYRKRRFKPLFGLRTWWKSRRFQYMVHIEAPEGCATKKCDEANEEEPKSGASAADDFITPLACYLEDDDTRGHSELLPRLPTVHSLNDSINTLDSVVDSHCTHSEDRNPESEGFVDKFLMEHLDFLSQSTQPQEVELVYNTH